MSLPQSINPQRHLSRRRNRRISCLKVVTTVAHLLASADAQEECQRNLNLNGWAASADCNTYFWCSYGTRSSMTYSCVDGQKFDASKSACLIGYTCPEVAAAPTITSDAAQIDASTSYPYLIKLGPATYYGDFRTTSCQNVNDSIQGKPDWVTEEDMFQSKEECCKESFSWIPLENCLGPGFKESNYVVGSRSPTLNPTMSPTMVPSVSRVPSPSPTLKLGPAVYYGDISTTECRSIKDSTQGKPDWVKEEHLFKMKEECCKEMYSWMPLENCLGPGFIESNYITSTPTISPTMVPSLRPSLSSLPSSSPSSSPSMLRELDSIPQDSSMTPPTTDDVPTAASDTQNQADANFLVDLLGWANADAPMLPEGSTIDMFSSTSPPVQEKSQISELTLPIISDATLSQSRPNANFGGNTALAVDGGSQDASSDSSGEKEKLDSLLKFDVGMLDSTQDIESAVLRVYALSNCLETTFTTTVDSDWNEDVTWDIAPTESGGVLFGAIKEVRQHQWYEIDIARAIKWHDYISPDDSNGSFLSIRLASSENSRCLYSSMESGGANAPVIVIKYLTHDVAAPKIAPGQFILLQADADSTISASNPTTVLSKEPSLKVDFDPVTRKIHDTLIRFDLSDTGGTNPRSAILSLFSEMSCPSAGTFATTEGSSNWDESTITWSTAPEASDGGNGVMIGTFGAVNKNKWYGFDVTDAIRVAILAKKKDVTFRISSGNTESCLYSSKESGREPKLMVSF